MKNLIITTFVFVFAICGAISASAQTGARLFEIKETPAARTEKSSIAAVRESEIAFGSLELRQAETLEIELFDGKSYAAKHFQTETRAMNDYTWRGKIREGKFEGDVVLTFRGGYVSGLIYAPLNQVYEIVPRGAKQILVEIDQSLYPECGGEVKSEETPVKSTTENNLASIDSGDRVDVMVVYTTATKNLLGGDAQAQVLVQQAIDSANTAYLNSKIRQRLRLVHTQEYLYTESGNYSTDLATLRSSTVIQGLRDTHKADLVAMIGEVTGVCGVGYLMGGVGGNQNNGFTVTTRSCAVGNLSFAHELGHNMGSQHNPESGSGATYTFGYGHYVNGVYRTVMSYVDPCPSGCTRRPYFSNPEVTFMGYQSGVDNARDNARSINLTADTIANYRYSGANLMLTNFNGGETLPRNIARNLTWTSENITGNVRIEISRDETTNWQTLIADTPNDGSESVVVYGTATKRARLRVVSLSNPATSDTSVRNISIR